MKKTRMPIRWHAILRMELDRLHTKTARFLYRFAFTKRDRRAIGILSGMIFLTLLLRAYGLVRPAKEWHTDIFQTASGLAKGKGHEHPPEIQHGGKGSGKPAETDSTKARRPYKPPEYMVRKKFTVNLNQADTFDLQEIRGIGPAFAKRIVRYRQNLGGFIKLEQLHEVWGVDSVLLENIRPHVFLTIDSITKINVNEADIKSLKRHPYLDYYQAKEIYLHRQKYGNFATVEELRTVNLIDSGTFARIAPYLRVR